MLLRWPPKDESRRNPCVFRDIQFSRCVPGPHFLTDPAAAGSPRFTGGPAVFYWVRKRPFTNTAKSTLFCSPKVNISLFLMESLHYGEILGEDCVNDGFYWGSATGICCAILKSEGSRCAGAGRRLAEEDEKPGSQGESVGLRLAEEKRKE